MENAADDEEQRHMESIDVQSYCRVFRKQVPIDYEKGCYDFGKVQEITTCFSFHDRLSII
jgi:hypothetical protein